MASGAQAIRHQLSLAGLEITLYTKVIGITQSIGVSEVLFS